MDNETILKAAAELENLTIIARQIVLDMRHDAQQAPDYQYAYARAYWLRAQISRKVVAMLGGGIPPKARYMDFYLKMIEETKLEGV